MASDGTIDAERLQSTLDDIADSVEWGADWITYLEDEEVRVGTSDREILRAQVPRLRLVADAVLPGRIRDERTGRRFYLAPDDVAARARGLGEALDDADREVARVQREVEATRAEEERRKERREREEAERSRRDAARRQQVRGFLATHGPATVAQIAAGTGLEKVAAEWAAKSVATRARGGRFVLNVPLGEDDDEEEQELEQEDDDEGEES